ncbi:MAG: hypothetical protein AAF585_24830, partial [Verrucomicrobiota bacterium]
MLQIQIKTRGSDEPPETRELTDEGSLQVAANQEITIIDTETGEPVEFEVEVQGENIIITVGEPGSEISFTFEGFLGDFTAGQQPTIIGARIGSLDGEVSSVFDPFEGVDLDPALESVLRDRLELQVLDLDRDPIFDFSGGGSGTDSNDSEGNQSGEEETDFSSIDQRIVAGSGSDEEGDGETPTMEETEAPPSAPPVVVEEMSESEDDGEPLDGGGPTVVPLTVVSGGPFNVDENSAAAAPVGDFGVSDTAGNLPDVNVSYAIVGGDPGGLFQ